MDSPWRIELFGGVTLRMNDRIVERFQTAKTGSLLAFLAWKQRPVTREALIDLLWPDADLEAARNRLRVTLNSLRRQLEPPGVPSGGVLVADRLQVSLRPGAFTTDVAEFDAALEQARAASDPDGRREALERAVRLYSGELLAGLYDEWILPERTRLADLCLGALKQLVRLLAQQQRYEAALEHAQRALAMDPLGESVHRSLMRLYARTGRRAAAVRQYSEVTRVLAEELGAEPAAATRRLGEKYSRGAGKRRTADKGERDRQAGTGGRDATAAGERRPRTRPRRPTPAEGPDPASPVPGTPSPVDPSATAGIPLQFTRFHGRDEELERLLAQLQPEPADGRLITITAPGGMGKTRVAVEAAQRLRDRWRERVWFVSMPEPSAARDPVEAVAAAMRLGPVTGLSTFERVLLALNEDASLLILDDVDVRRESSTAWLAALRDRVPRLTCLCTARRRLELDGEIEVVLPPLPVPQKEGESAWRLMACPSVALFVDRGQAARPDFQVTAGNAAAVRALCRGLEGVPLALELAAAWAQVLTPAQMLERLRDRFGLLVSRRRARHDRHQSLRAAIESSVDLLDSEQREAFVALAIFRGGWTLEAAESVLDGEVLRALDHLNRHALIRSEEEAGGMRFSMLDSLREYAAEQADPRAWDANRAAHARWFHRLACDLSPVLCGPHAEVALERLDTEHDNLDFALDSWLEAEARESAHALEHAQPPGGTPHGLEMAVALWRFWLARGQLTEGAAQLQRALALPSSNRVPALRTAALEALGRAAQGVGDRLSASSHFLASLELARSLGDTTVLRRALLNAALSASDLGDHAGACALYAELARGDEAEGDAWRRARTLEAWGRAALACGRMDEATHSLEEALALRRAVGDRWGSADILLTLGGLPGDDAAAHHAEGQALFAALEDAYGLGVTCLNVGSLAGDQGDLTVARELLASALETFRDLRDPWYEALAHGCLASVAEAQHDEPAARSHRAEVITLRRTLPNRPTHRSVPLD